MADFTLVRRSLCFLDLTFRSPPAEMGLTKVELASRFFGYQGALLPTRLRQFAELF